MGLLISSNTWKLVLDPLGFPWTVSVVGKWGSWWIKNGYWWILLATDGWIWVLCPIHPSSHRINFINFQFFLLYVRGGRLFGTGAEGYMPFTCWSSGIIWQISKVIVHNNFTIHYIFLNLNFLQLWIIYCEIVTAFDISTN